MKRGFTRRQALRTCGATLAGMVAAAAGTVWGRPAPVLSRPLRIGVSLSLSGPFINDGNMQLKAYQLWENQVNSRGGILGRPVQMIIRDDRSEPDAARAVYQDYLAHELVDCLLGPYSSMLTLAVAPLAEQYGYPMLAAGAAADDIWRQGYRYVFGTIPVAGRQAIGLLAILADAGIDSLALVQADDPYSRTLAEGAKKWAGQYGVRITSVQQVVRGTTDLAPVARVARQSGSQALLMTGHFDESVNMRRALRQIDWTPAAFFASVGPTQDKYAAVLKGDEEGVLASSTWEAREDLALPGSAAFLRDFIRIYGNAPSFIAAQAYAAGQILERAIVKAGGFDRKPLRDALAQLDTEVITGRYAVDDSGMLTKRFALIIQWQKGRREVVWPPEMKTAAVRLAR